MWNSCEQSHHRHRRSPGARLVRSLGLRCWTLAGLWACSAVRADGVDSSAGREEAALTNALGVQFPDPVSLSPDGRLLLLKRLDADAFELRVVERSSGHELLRHRSAQRQMAPVWRPDSRAIAFAQDSDGNQQFHLTVWNLDKNVVSHSPTLGSMAMDFVWSPNGTQLAYVVESRKRSVQQLIITAPNDWTQSRVLATNVARRKLIAWAPDGRSLATTVRGDEGGLRIVSPDGGSRRIRLVPHGEITAVAWLRAGRGIVVAGRRAGEENTELETVDGETGRITSMTQSDGTITAIRELGSGFTYEVTVDGRSYAVLVPGLDRGARMSLENVPGTTVALGMSPQGDTVIGVHTGLTTPPTLMDLPASGPIRWKERESAGSGVRRYVSSRALQLQAADGRQVPAYLWAPMGTAGAPRAPRALILVHGGPALQTMRTWDAGIQEAVRRGVSVIAVNYRGSTGYGAGFEGAGDDLTGQVSDVEAACAYARHVLGVPTSRIVLWGHSYGALVAIRLLAANRARVGRAIIISLVPGPGGGKTHEDELPEIWSFQGTDDAVQDPSAARAQIVAEFGRVVAWTRVRPETMVHEGHNFRRLRSWARVWEVALQ